MDRRRDDRHKAQQTARKSAATSRAEIFRYVYAWLNMQMTSTVIAGGAKLLGRLDHHDQKVNPESVSLHGDVEIHGGV